MLVESKSNLARLMATENLVVEQRVVHTASFDIKNRILTVPVLNGNLSNEVIDLLLGHEVGHALETPEQGWHDSIVDLKVNRSILNVCEDVRIEKKIKRKFPGIKISFVKGYRELLEMDFFGVKGKNLNTLNFIDRLNLHEKGGAAQGIDFSEEEYVLVREVENAETFEETVAIAMKIQKFMKEQPQVPVPGEQIEIVEISEDGAEEMIGETIESMDFDSGEKTEGEAEKENQTKESVESNPADEVPKGEGGTGDKKQKSNEISKETGTSSAGTDEGEIESETDNAFREKEKELYQNKNQKGSMYSNVPEVILENIIVDYKTLIQDIETHNNDSFKKEWFYPEKMRQNYNKFRTESNKVVSYLVKEFEMRKNAEQQSRAKISKTGELNLSKIHEYKFTDDIFARMTKVPNGKSHGLVLFVDWSGSMVDHINPTVKQLLNLVMFCKKVNIPFEVYAFSTNVPLAVSKMKTPPEVQKTKIGDLGINQFSLLNILSHKMNANDFSKMASYLLDYGTGRRGSCSKMEPPHIMELSGTPLNEAVISAFKIIPKFKFENKLQIVNTVFLTDGEGSGLRGQIFDEQGWTIPVNSNYKLRSFFRDPVTKASVELFEGAYGYASNSATQTTALLTLLKQRTGSNVIGFYIAKVRDVRHALMIYSPKSEESKIDKRVLDFRKDNFTYLNNVGYDEYYFLRSDTLDTDEDGSFEVSSTTTRGLVSAFSKYTGNRVSNRIVLNRFINLVA